MYLPKVRAKSGIKILLPSKMRTHTLADEGDFRAIVTGGEVAMTYFTGGGTAGYFNWGVGFVTNTEYFRRVATGAFDRNRIGDYLTVRPGWNSNKRYSASGYVLDGSNRFHPWWALFGRRGDKPKSSSGRSGPGR